MKASINPVSADLQASATPTDGACTLHVCTSCRLSTGHRSSANRRPGSRLFRELREAIAQSPLRDRVKVQPAECLSVCPRPCGIALTAADSWTWLFGDQVPTETTSDILKCLERYLDSPDGFLARLMRPKTLQKSILGRIPPSLGASACI